ncbi:MAG: glycosyltransferase, partial [Gammaproteobacteria bacterium]|nr:glycosyltransferase [Gammaproteobacteria bacterium]
TRKAQMRSLNAFNLLKKRLPDVSVKLLYVGSRKILDSEIHYEKIMKEKIEELNLSKDIAFYPATSNMKPFYAVTDVLLVPSVSEVLPLVIFEGMAFHLPIIASKIDGIPEAIQHGKNGFLISQGDIAALELYMQILTCDSSLRKSLGDAGNKILRNRFRIQDMLNQYSMIVDAITA